jgi:hypothetical protein
MAMDLRWLARRDLGQGWRNYASRSSSQNSTRGYESAARCLSDDLDALVQHLRNLLRHRGRWRSTNLERLLGEDP